jgi:hypothetical protein
LAEGPGRGIGGKLSVVAFAAVVNQIIWIADPPVTCVVGDIFLVSKLQQDRGVWVWEGDRVFRNDEKVNPALHIAISRAISEGCSVRCLVGKEFLLLSLPRAFWISVYVGLPQTVVARIAVVTE